MCVIIVEVTINIPYSLEIAPLQLKALPYFLQKNFCGGIFISNLSPPYVQFTAL